MFLNPAFLIFGSQGQALERLLALTQAPRPKGTVPGPATEVLRTTVATHLTPLDHCRQMFLLLNAGSCHSDICSDPRAAAYRATGHRSLAPGDYISVDGQFFQLHHKDWMPVDPPHLSSSPHLIIC